MSGFFHVRVGLGGVTAGTSGGRCAVILARFRRRLVRGARAGVGAAGLLVGTRLRSSGTLRARLRRAVRVAGLGHRLAGAGLFAGALVAGFRALLRVGVLILLERFLRLLASLRIAGRVAEFLEAAAGGVAGLRVAAGEVLCELTDFFGGPLGVGLGLTGTLFPGP